MGPEQTRLKCQFHYPLWLRKVTSICHSCFTTGDRVNFTYSITNSGNGTLTQIQIAATGPVTPAPADCTPTPGEGMVLASLAPGASIVCTTAYTATQADLNANTNLVATLAPVAKGPAGVVTVNTADKEVVVDALQNPSWTVALAREANTVYDKTGERPDDHAIL
jgi:hypothetical protein